MAQTPDRTPRPPRRPVVGSRNPTGRPRSVAGRRPETAPGAVPETTADSAPEAEAPVVEPGETSPRSRLLTSARTTVVLVVALALMSGVLAAEAWYVWFKPEPVVSAERPVVVGEVAHRAAVEAARQSTEEILSYGYQDFDAEIEDATTKMTDEFAQRFRDTATDVKDRFVRQRTEQEVQVVAASVVQASSEQVRALLFLDQYVVRADEGTTKTPYRALVTMVHTDSGWLVSDIETR